MSYITVSELCDFAHKFPEDEDSLQIYVDGAEEAIKNYLNYDPTESEYETIIRSEGGVLLPLKAKPITSISEMYINDIRLNQQDFMQVDGSTYIEHKALIPFQQNAIYKIVYTAGWEDIPSIIKLTALQIACLLWESGEGKLAVTSTSFADAGTRTFNNFTMDRFLKQLESYRAYSS